MISLYLGSSGLFQPSLLLQGGQVISYGIGAAFAQVPHGWRYMVGIGQCPTEPVSLR